MVLAMRSAFVSLLRSLMEFSIRYHFWRIFSESLALFTPNLFIQYLVLSEIMRWRFISYCRANSKKQLTLFPRS